MFPEAELTELLNEFENNDDGNFENEEKYNVGSTFETTKKWERKPFDQPRLSLENLDQPIYPILLRSPLECLLLKLGSRGW